MLKKIVATMSIACVVIASFASVCSANYNIVSRGCDNKYNGSYWYDQAWARVSASGQDYNVLVGVKKNGTHYGDRPNVASEGYTTYCWSYEVQGSGGTGARVIVT